MLDRDEPDGTLSDFYRPTAPSSGSIAKRISTGRGRPVAVDFPEDADDGESGEFLRSNRRVKVRRGLIPEGRLGRIAIGTGALLVAGAVLAAVLEAHSFLLHDPRFRIESSTSVQILGNSHVTRPELLNTFGEDIGRNIFYVPLAARRADLEALPWVEHATVMRLLPNRLRVSVVERTPVAFVRQGSHIGLVDSSGVLLDMPADGAGPHYSFPVVVGINANEPLSTRAARMKIYQRFAADLDATGEKISEKLSEVDLSDPEDVKALIPDENVDILVHFGDQEFLTRYHSYEAHLQEWKQQYPRLGSVDMRYEQQIVLEMQPGSTVPVNGAQTAQAAAKPVDTPAGKPRLSATPNATSNATRSATSNATPNATSNASSNATRNATPRELPARNDAKKVLSKQTVPSQVKQTALSQVMSQEIKSPATAKTSAPELARTAATSPSKWTPTGQSANAAANTKPAATSTAVAKAANAIAPAVTAAGSATSPAGAKAITLQGTPIASQPMPQSSTAVKLAPGPKPETPLKTASVPPSTPAVHTSARAVPAKSNYHWTPLPAGRHTATHSRAHPKKQFAKTQHARAQAAKPVAKAKPASQTPERAQ